MENKFAVNSQVVHRRKMRTGNQIRIGTILGFRDEGRKAVVTFPADRTRAEVPVDQLEPVQARYGRANVHPNAALRGISFLR